MCFHLRFSLSSIYQYIKDDSGEGVTPSLTLHAPSPSPQARDVSQQFRGLAPTVIGSLSLLLLLLWGGAKTHRQLGFYINDPIRVDVLDVL